MMEDVLKLDYFYFTTLGYRSGVTLWHKESLRKTL